MTNFGGLCPRCGLVFFDDELLSLFVKQHGYMEAESPALD